MFVHDMDIYRSVPENKKICWPKGGPTFHTNGIPWERNVSRKRENVGKGLLLDVEAVAIASCLASLCNTYIIKVMHLHISLIIKNNRPPIYVGSSIEGQSAYD